MRQPTFLVCGEITRVHAVFSSHRFESKGGPAIVHKVELDIPSTPKLLPLLLLGCVFVILVLRHKRHVLMNTAQPQTWTTMVSTSMLS
jgi:hypothetical protein